MQLNYFVLPEKQFISDDADFSMSEKALFFQRNRVLKNEHLETKLMKKQRISYQNLLYRTKMNDLCALQLDYLMNTELVLSKQLSTGSLKEET
jgi:hypothetical protein